MIVYKAVLNRYVRPSLRVCSAHHIVTVSRARPMARARAASSRVTTASAVARRLVSVAAECSPPGGVVAHESDLSRAPAACESGCKPTLKMVSFWPASPV